MNERNKEKTERNKWKTERDSWGGRRKRRRRRRRKRGAVVIKSPPLKSELRFRGHFIWTDRRSYGVEQQGH